MPVRCCRFTPALFTRYFFVPITLCTNFRVYFCSSPGFRMRWPFHQAPWFPYRTRKHVMCEQVVYNCVLHPTCRCWLTTEHYSALSGSVIRSAASCVESVALDPVERDAHRNRLAAQERACSIQFSWCLACSRYSKVCITHSLRETAVICIANTLFNAS
jgi:hypothetical protein